jgi:hypothetical protein
MGYRADVVSYLLNQAPKDQQQAFGIVVETTTPPKSSL